MPMPIPPPYLSMCSGGMVVNWGNVTDYYEAKERRCKYCDRLIPKGSEKCLHCGGTD